jgi:hypothetical protein
MQQPRHVFIVTAGRTGSTLVLGILNSYDGVDIRGENFGFLYYQYKAIEALKVARAHLGTDKASQSPFYGADRVDIGAIEDRIMSTCREFVDGGRASTIAIGGFKEVRYDMPDLKGYLAFLMRLFPSCLFIFLMRETADIVSSGFWKSMPASAATAKVEAMHGRFRAFAAQHSVASALIDYRDLVQPGEALAALVARLGLPYDGERVSSALGIPYSYDLETVRFHDNSRLQLVPRRELETRLRAMAFDRLKASDDGASIVLGGTLLPHADMPAINSVFAIQSGKPGSQAGTRKTGDTGLPSPGIRQKFPDDPRSATARFKLGVDTIFGSAEIYFVQGSDVVKLGQLTMHEPQPRHFFEPSAGFANGSSA